MFDLLSFGNNICTARCISPSFEPFIDRFCSRSLCKSKINEYSTENPNGSHLYSIFDEDSKLELISWKGIRFY